jgi:hypothetical protein
VVAGAELFERPVGDVLAPVGAVFGVGVAWVTFPSLSCNYAANEF